jgi:arginine-tRNA-protein transferase
MERMHFINQEFVAPEVTGAELDLLLADAWRHFGERFFRYNLGIYREEVRFVTPLRVRLSDTSFSKSQRRNLRQNADLSTVIRPIRITPDTEGLFHRHKTRFEHGVPGSIFEFLSHEPSSIPCEGKEVAVYDGEKLVAASFFDVGEVSTSSIYAVFDPYYSARGLGIYTMLKEIEYSRETGKEFYYHGYAYAGESFYDYKKRFSGLEVYDWGGGSWREYGG